MIRIAKLLLLILLLLTITLPSAVYAQGDMDPLQLGLTRNFGYGGLGKIQGNFTLKILDPPAELDLVDFYLDDKLIAAVNDPPYIYKFHTGEFSDGEHKMFAVGYLVNGDVTESNRISKIFLSSDQAWSETQNILVPLLIGTAVLTLMGIGVPLLLNKDKEFVLGTYGLAGGTVCPRCELPFSRSVMSPNLMVGKLVRCPHCGKISILPRATQTRLQEAENKFSNKDRSSISQVESDDLSRLIEDSRFED